MKNFLFILFFYLNFNNLYAIDSKANQAIVMDYNTDEILFEKNANAIVPPASLTKIITIYVAIKLIDGPAANNLILSRRGALYISSCSGSAKAPMGRGPTKSNPKLRIFIPCALAWIP